MPTEEERNRAKKGIKARQDAIKALIANHQDEFDRIHAANRVAAGLPRRSAGPTVEVIEGRLKKAQEQMEKWQRELELVKSSS